MNRFTGRFRGVCRMLSTTVLFLLGAGLASAQTPTTISYQGLVTDNAGTAPVPDGNYQMTFRLYSAPTGGTPLWEETQSTQILRGLFKAYLGSTTPFAGSSVAFNQRLYLGVTINNGTELPRTELSKVPFAFHADNAATADIATTVVDGAITVTKLA
ncbi:MAG: hypothetical protein JNJ94_08825, partial [Chlorobi bacterium]|nr:hypothetical protein [Chlorobiota bacterium]